MAVWITRRSISLEQLAQARRGKPLSGFEFQLYVLGRVGWDAHPSQGHLRLIQLDGRGGESGKRPGVFILLCHAVTQNLRLLSRVALSQLRRGRKVRTGGYFCNYHDLKHSEVSS